MKDAIKEKVFTAIGEASMCWDPIPTGVFDSTAAQKVAERLVADLASAVPVEEPLAVFVEQHGWFLKDIMHFQAALTWSICLCRKQSSVNYESFKQIEARTYAECEAKARAFLAGLPDKETINTDKEASVRERELIAAYSAGKNDSVNSIAISADKRGLSLYIRRRLRGAFPSNQWAISLNRRGGGTQYIAYGPTYAEAEAKARAFLSGLPDKETI